MITMMIMIPLLPIITIITMNLTRFVSVPYFNFIPFLSTFRS